MSIASTHDLAEATATVIAFGHCGKLVPGLADPVVRTHLSELLDLVARAESALVGYDGFGPGGDGQRSSHDPERLTPLEQHMANIDEGRTGPTDTVYTLAAAATDDLIEAGRRLRAMAHKLTLAREQSTPRKPNAHSEAICAEDRCDKPIARGRGGRCEACYRWRRRWMDDHPGELAPPVPDHIFDERDRAERGGKVHVTGPLADGAAS